MKKAISIIICVVLFFFICTDLFMFSLNRIASVNFVNAVIDDINISDAIKSLRESNSSEAGELLNDLYDKAEERGFSEEEMNNIMDSDMTKEIIEVYASNMLEDGKSLTEEDINKILENNVDEIIDNSNGVFSKEDRARILRAGETMAPTIAKNLPDMNQVNEIVGVDNVEQVQNGFNSNNLFFIIMLVLTIVLFAVLTLMQWKKYKWLLYTSITILVSSIIVILFTLLGQSGINLIMSENSLMNNIVLPIVSNITKNIYIISGTCFVLSIIEMVVYNILKKKNMVTKKGLG